MNSHAAKKTVILSFILAFGSCRASATEYYVNLFHAHGWFLYAKDGGGGPPWGTGLPRGRMMANGFSPPDLLCNWILRDLNGGTLEHGDEISLRTGPNGLYLSAELGGGGLVIANRIGLGAWETFTIHKVNGSGAIGNSDEIALQASNGQFLCAEYGGGAHVVADRSGIGSWETFRLQIWGTGPPYWYGPIFELSPWNDWDGQTTFGVQFNNNCYNYGSNRITGTWAQPGYASGSKLAGFFTKSQIIEKLINDGWEPTHAGGVSAEGKMKVFIAVAPTSTPGWFFDFHLYRQDVPTYYGAGWSHKAGNTTARDVDFSDMPISNPEICDRGEWSDHIGYWFIPTFTPQGQGKANIDGESGHLNP